MVDTLLLRKRKVRTMKNSQQMNVEIASRGVDHVIAADYMVEVLERDQRTCNSPVTINYDDMWAEQVIAESAFQVRTENNNYNNTYCSSTKRQSQRQRHLQSNISTSRWPHILVKRSLHRLSELVVIGVCLLSIISPTMSAPASPSQSRPKWINPCGLGSSVDIDSELVDLGLRLNDQELLSQIVVQAKNALMYADLFKDDYVKNTFNLDFQQHHDSWKKNHYEWLPSEEDIPKKLGEPTPIEHLKSLGLDKALKDTFTYMQKMAVGLEQVVWDQGSEHGDYHKEFMDTEYKLRATLCEIQVAILERNVKQHDDVTRELMGDEYRRMDNASYRNLRDWLIFRDYMNGLEYVIEVFEYFKHKLNS